MADSHNSDSGTSRMLSDMGKGFGSFVDTVLRGRDSNALFNTSIGLSALDIGWPAATESGALPANFPRMLTNNAQLANFDPNHWGSHPLFDFSADNFTLFGLDFPDMWNHLLAGTGYLNEEAIEELKSNGALGAHRTPFYTNSEEGGVSNIATSIGLPDLPYGEMAHFAHIGMAFYDTGRTFIDLWNDPALKHNVLKIVTHPEVAHTLLHRGVMLTVMGLLHPLGMVVAIGVSYLCAHLVHSAFELLERNKDIVRQIENVPVLREIYNASGIKEWAESEHRFSAPHGGGHKNEALDPLGEPITLRPDTRLSVPPREAQRVQPVAAAGVEAV